MIKDILKNTQPIAYQTLINGLKNHTMAHAYLFQGPKGTGKKEAALLLACSIIEHCEGFALEDGNTWERIKNLEYGDLIYIDGSAASIKKEDIQDIQEQFSKTALEASGEKVYIIDHIENATIASLNSLLKFLEEPTSNITAILLVDNIDNLLETIVSRCQIIPFRQTSFNQVYKYYLDNGIDRLDSYMAAHLSRNMDLTIFEDESFQMGIALLLDFIKNYPAYIDMFLVNAQKDMFKQDKKSKDEDDESAMNKNVNLEAFRWFISMSALFFEDTINDGVSVNEEYDTALQRVKKIDLKIDEILLVLLQTRDLINKNYDFRLVLDQMIYKLREIS